jgi:hypothetical protein
VIRLAESIRERLGLPLLPPE